MNCEIELMPVGSGSKPGDAIVTRYGTPEFYELMIVDGGTKDTGEALVKHVQGYFGRDKPVTHVVLTHSDADHASGLRAVLSELVVQNVWLHVPWTHAADALPYFKNKNWKADSLSDAIRIEYELIAEIVQMAYYANASIHFPFQGAAIGPFRVLSPHQTAYTRLIPPIRSNGGAGQGRS